LLGRWSHDIVGVQRRYLLSANRRLLSGRHCRNKRDKHQPEAEPKRRIASCLIESESALHIEFSNLIA
jgi:hypothetical protein